MSSTGKWLTTAVVLTLLGAMIFLVVFCCNDFDFSKLSAQKIVTNTYVLNDEFDDIAIDVSAATVTFVKSDDGECKVECLEYENFSHKAVIEDKTLMVSVSDSRKWYEHIGINIESPKVTLYLPKDAYTSLSVINVTGDVEIPDTVSFESVLIEGATANILCNAAVEKIVEIKTTTGNINLSSDEIKTVKLMSTTGRIKLSGVTCDDITVKSTTGDIDLIGVDAKTSLNAEATTGSVEFLGCDAESIVVKTSTGDVVGSLRSEKIFVINTATGHVRVPDTSSGGKCEITTSTGNIEIEIK